MFDHADGFADADGISGLFLLLPGIFLSGLAFDRGTGVLAAVIAVGVGAYFGYRTDFGFEYFSTNGLFAITAAGTAVVAEFLRAEMKRVMQADKTKALLLQEMAHRTKNNLAKSIHRSTTKSTGFLIASHPTCPGVRI